jgi:hypothetical protein
MATPQLIDYHLLMTPDATVIYPSRRKLLLLICGGAGFVALGIFLLQSIESRQRLSGLASILFLAFAPSTVLPKWCDELRPSSFIPRGFLFVQSDFCAGTKYLAFSR